MSAEHAKATNLANVFIKHILEITEEMPTTAIILGSGLANSFDESKHFSLLGEMERDKINRMILHNSLPEFTAERHELRILIAEEKNTRKKILVVCGRKHLNEIGVHEQDKMQRILRIPRALIYAGIKNIIHTSAVGGINPSEPGSIILVSDHDGGEDLPMHLFSGVDNKDFGPIHSDCQEMYYQPDSEKIRSLTTPGVLMWCLGPNFETPAQIRRFEMFGIAGVGMSMLPESMAVAQIKLHPSGTYSEVKNIGLGIVSNPAAGKGGVITDEDVKNTTESMGDAFTEVIAEIVRLV